MKITGKHILALCLTLILILGLCFGTVAADTEQKVTVLFTHDLHSHFLPAPAENGGESGGYARLMTVIREQKAKYPNAIVVDAGDFSMGSLFQTAYAADALELRMMGTMGYDATTFGNHEFDYLPQGLASMLNAAAECGETVPAIVDANYLPPVEGDPEYDREAGAVWAAMENYGVKDFILLERGGVYFAIFGITGFDSDDCAPNSGMILQDPVKTAQKTVDAAVAACVEQYGAEPVVVCLSHSGTEDGKGEDYTLAQKVSGIDLIISGHSHTTLEQPIQVGDTYIVSAGEYGKYLGVVQMDYYSGKAVLTDYELIPVNETVKEDETIAARVQSCKETVEKDYLSQYGMTFDQVLTENPYTFDTLDQVYDTQHESTLGNLFSDAYQWAAEQTLGQPVDLALTASGVIRESIPLGAVTVSDVFNAASLGVGTEGELVSVYITGADLKTAMEVDASVQPLMSGAQLFMSGVEYSFNTNRMIFNKVDYAMLRRSDGSLEKIEDDRLYRVVTGMYVGQMLGSVKETSFGLLEITPRDAEGNPIAPQQLADHVIRDSQGNAVKEWYAIAAYLRQMGGEVDAAYAQTDGRKVVYSSWNPVKLLRNANRFTWILLAVLLLLVLAVVLIVRKVRKAIRKKGNRHAG